MVDDSMVFVLTVSEVQLPFEGGGSGEWKVTAARIRAPFERDRGMVALHNDRHPVLVVEFVVKGTPPKVGDRLTVRIDADGRFDS